MISIIFLLIIIIILLVNREKFILPYNEQNLVDFSGHPTPIILNPKFKSSKYEISFSDMEKIANTLKNKINISENFYKQNNDNIKFITNLASELILKEIKRISGLDWKIHNTIPLNIYNTKNNNFSKIYFFLHIYRPKKIYYYILYFEIFINLNELKILVKECDITGVKIEDKLHFNPNTSVNNSCQNCKYIQ